MADYPKFYIVNTSIDETPTFRHAELWIEIETPDGVKIITYEGGPQGGIGNFGNLLLFRDVLNRAVDSDDMADFDATEIIVPDEDRVDILNAIEAAYLNLGTANSDLDVDTNIDYKLLGPNSNSFINTLLNAAGIDFRDNAPHVNAL